MLNSPELIHVVHGAGPVDLASAGLAAAYKSMKDYQSCTVIFHAAGGGAEDPTITLNQATDTGGATNKPLNFSKILVTEATSLAALDVPTEYANSGNTFTKTGSGALAKIWRIDIEADTLDSDGGYTAISASVADPGSIAQLGSILYVFRNPRYPRKPALTAE